MKHDKQINQASEISEDTYITIHLSPYHSWQGLTSEIPMHVLDMMSHHIMSQYTISRKYFDELPAER